MSRSSESKLGEKNRPKLTKRQRKKQRMRQIILDAARKLFTEKSYDEATMEEIADQAALSRATLYNYFESKETIYFEIGIQGWKFACKQLKALITTESSGLDQILKLHNIALRDTLERPLGFEILRYFMIMDKQAEYPAEKLLEKLQLSENHHQETIEASDLIRVRYLCALLEFEKVWTDIIQRGQEDGSIRTDLKADQLTYFIIMIYSGMLDVVNLYRIPRKKLIISTEQIAKMTLEVIRNYLEAR